MSLLEVPSPPIPAEAQETGLVVPPSSRRELRGSRGATARRALALAAAGTAVAAAVLFAIALPSMRTASWSELGLLFAASPAFVLSLVLAPVACCLALAAGSRRLAWVALVVTVLVHRLPLTLATDAPAYSWTGKHLGVTDLIGAHGGVVPGVDIYQAWPGMFAAAAWLQAVTGLDPMVLAHWFPVLAQLAFTLAVYAFARSAGRTRETALTAALIAQLANWVGQDYFSPQAVAAVLAVGALALLLRSRRHPAFAWLALVLFAAVTVTHQLTPYWLTAVVVAFCILGAARPRWIAVLFIAVAGGYLALNYDVVQQFGPLLSVDAAANVRTVNLDETGPGQALAALGGRIATALLWVGALLAFVTALVRHRRGRAAVLALGAAAFAPFALLLGQGYGGEALFRVMLYSIPGCAVLVAPWIRRLLAVPGGARVGRRAVRTSTRRRGVRIPRPMRTRAVRIAAGSVVVAVLAVSSAQAYFGAWFAYQVSPETYRDVSAVLRSAPEGALVLGVAPGAPGRTVAEYAPLAIYDPQFDAVMTTWDGWRGTEIGDAERIDRFTRDLIWQGRPTYIVMTDEMKSYSDFYRVYPEGAIDEFERLLLAHPRWTTVVHDDHATIVRLADDPAAG